MEDRATKFGSGLAALAVLWIAIYWLWTPGTGGLITFDARPPEPVVHVSRQADRTSNDPEQGEGSDVNRGPDSDVAADSAGIGGSGSGGSDPDGGRDGSGTIVGPMTPDEASPEGGSTPEPRLVPPEFRAYTVKSGDTFGSIAQRELGSARWATALLKANPLKSPDRLKIGDEIRIPVDPTNIQGKVEGEGGSRVEPPPAAYRSYTVRDGDTLTGIASRMLGSSSKWESLFDLNRDQLRTEHDLRVGQVLKLPPP